MNVKDPQHDPVFREQAEVYSLLGGEVPVRMFQGIEKGASLNDLMEELIDEDFRGMDNDGEPQPGVTRQLLHSFDGMAEKNLVQRAANSWVLTGYGESWYGQMQDAINVMEELVEDDVVSGGTELSGVEAALLFEGPEDIGDLYAVLGYDLNGGDEYPEALPAFHLLHENQGEAPARYVDAVEQLWHMDIVESYSLSDSGDEVIAPLTAVGERVYSDVLMEDREMVKDHYGL